MNGSIPSNDNDPRTESPRESMQQKPWSNYTLFQHRQPPPSKDYLSDVPKAVSFAVQFFERILGFHCEECQNDMSNELLQVVDLEKLESLSRYCNGLNGLWYCTASSIQVANATIVYIPVYSMEDSQQMKFWIAGEKMIGLEFNLLNEAKWASNGEKLQRWIVHQPKIVTMTDGTTKEIHSRKEEQEALLDPKVPVGIQVGQETRYRMMMQQAIELKQRKPSLKRIGKDGKKYYVFAEFNATETTRSVHAEAICRQYWIPKKDDGIAFVYLLDRNGEPIASSEPYVELSDGRLELLSIYK